MRDNRTTSTSLGTFGRIERQQPPDELESASGLEHFQLPFALQVRVGGLPQALKHGVLFLQLEQRPSGNAGPAGRRGCSSEAAAGLATGAVDGVALPWLAATRNRDAQIQRGVSPSFSLAFVPGAFSAFSARDGRSIFADAPRPSWSRFRRQRYGHLAMRWIRRSGGRQSPREAKFWLRDNSLGLACS